MQIRKTIKKITLLLENNILSKNQNKNIIVFRLTNIFYFIYVF